MMTLVETNISRRTIVIRHSTFGSLIIYVPFLASLCSLAVLEEMIHLINRKWVIRLGGSARWT
ncbi:hypothetical protein ACVLD2_000351 [Paenibacillus sp. PvR052]